LRNPIYSETSAYGHMGREPQTVTKVFTSHYMPAKTVTVELFTWEKLDYVDKIKKHSTCDKRERPENSGLSSFNPCRVMNFGF